MMCIEPEDIGDSCQDQVAEGVKDESSFPWPLVLVIAGVSLIALIVFLAIFLVRFHKSSSPSPTVGIVVVGQATNEDCNKAEMGESGCQASDQATDQI
jgi:hypothetical protein